MMNCFDFGGGPRLRRRAMRTIDPILTLRNAMQHLEAPTIYVNDNFGEWHSEKSKLVERSAEQAPEIVGPLAPRDEDYFIIKPQFSGFYATNLPLLLPKLGVSRLVLTGIAADICVLFTAADAHMRDYALWVPEDAVAAEVDTRAQAALELMREHLGAETSATTDLEVPSWMKALDERGVR
jgi:nicotinamidase-related amidase